MKELNKIQVELRANKDLFNSYAGYGYRSAESILEALKPLLNSTGCTVIITDDIVLVGDRIYVKATAVIKNESGDTEQAVAFAREAAEKKGQDVAQTTGAASSYARKYALCGLLAIDDRRDSDATNKGNNPIDDARLKSEFETVKKKLNACKSRQDVVDLNAKHENLWNYQPYIQLRDQKWSSLPQ